MAKKRKGPLVVLVLSSKNYDDSAFVHKSLDEVHDKNGISIVAHLGRGAGAFASAWSRIAKPQPVSEFISRASSSKIATTAVMESHVDLIIAFGSFKALASIRKLATKKGIAVLHRTEEKEVKRGR